MRLAITTVKEKGKWKVLEGPNEDISGQKERFKEIILKDGDGGKIEEAQLWTSSRGMVKRKRFASKTERRQVESAKAAEAAKLGALEKETPAEAPEPAPETQEEDLLTADS